MDLNSTIPLAIAAAFLAGVFQRLGGRGLDDSVPGEVIKITPSGDRTT